MKNIAMLEELIAPYGMNCGVCISYLTMKYDLNRKGFKKRYCPECGGEICCHNGL